MITVFIDGFSRMKVAKVVKHKSQAVDKLADFKRAVADSNQLAIKALCSDRGGELTGIAF